MMDEYCLTFQSILKGGFKNGLNHFKQHAIYLKGLEWGKKPQCLHGVRLGFEALRRWVIANKNLDKTVARLNKNTTSMPLHDE